MTEVKEIYHKADITHACCLRCHKPMSEWRAFDVCFIDAPPSVLVADKGHVSLHTPEFTIATNGKQGLLIIGQIRLIFSHELLVQFLEKVSEEFKKEHGKFVR